MDRNPTQTANGTGGAWIGTARTLTGIPTGTALRTATVAVAGLKGEGGLRSGRNRISFSWPLSEGSARQTGWSDQGDVHSCILRINQLGKSSGWFFLFSRGIPKVPCLRRILSSFPLL